MLAILIMCLFVGIALAVLLAIVVLPGVIWAEKKFKQDAYRILENPELDPLTIRRCIKGLSAYQDEEAREFVRRLMALQFPESKDLMG